jgi:hypothetical protein
VGMKDNEAANEHGCTRMKIRLIRVPPCSLVAEYLVLKTDAED